MTWLRVLSVRLLAYFKRGRLDRELDEELDTHLQMLLEENLRRGLSPEQAQRAARREFGGVEQVRESYRDQRGLPLLETMLQDVRYALRVLRLQPSFSAAALLTVALGIGASTSIFSVVDAVLLRPLPYNEPDRLVALWENNLRESDHRYPLAPANYTDFRAHSKSFEGVAAYMSFTIEQILSGTEVADRVRAAFVSPELFQLLGVRATVGRTFLPAESQPEHSGVVLLSSGFWRRRFGGDPAVLGRTLTLDDTPCSIVGILPPEFRFPSREVEIWRPLTFAGTVFPQNRITTRSVHYLGAVGRLRPGVSPEQARTELNGIAKQLEQAYPDSNKDIGATVHSLLDEAVGKVRVALLVLSAAVGFVLLIACANVANLMLARSCDRRKEIAVRAAIGAGRGRIFRQLLTENILLAVIGGIIGLLFAYWGTRLLIALGPDSIPRLDQVGLNGAVLAFAILVSAATGILFGMVPAYQLSQTDLSSSLKEGGREQSESRGHGRLRLTLVAFEIALSLILLVGAGLMFRSFSRLLGVDPGFDPENLLTMEIMLPQRRYLQAEQRSTFYQRLFEGLESLPGVRYAGDCTRLPLGYMSRTSNPTSALTIEGRNVPEGQKPAVDFRRAGHDYFPAMGVPLLAGRLFTGRDSTGAPRVALINEQAARLFFSGLNPVGQRIQLGPQPQSDWYTIVGIVGSLHHLGLDIDPRPEVYVHSLQNPPTAPFIVLRTVEDPLGFVQAARSEVHKIDRGVPVFNIATMKELVADSMREREYNLFLMTAFAGLALALAAVGIYGVVAYAVSQRTHEIGIRMALGAGRHDIARLVMEEVLNACLAGLGIGLVVAFGLTRLMSTLLFEVRPTDPMTYAGVAAVLVGIAATAAFMPLRRAVNVEPTVALRQE